MIKILTKTQFESQAFKYWAKTGILYNNYKHYTNFIYKELKNDSNFKNTTSTKYIWKTKGDSKVRDEHEERDGEIFDWNEGLKPGEDYGCRCLATFIDEDKYPTGNVRRMKYNKDTKEIEEQKRDKPFISSHYGEPRGNGKKHTGIDFRMPEGTPIKAVKGGVVKKAGWENPSDHKQGYGQRVKILNDDGTYSDYGHMLETPLVKTEEHVKMGQKIGKVGNTGSSTGSHLHYNSRDSNYKIIKPSQEEVVEILDNFSRQYFD